MLTYKNGSNVAKSRLDTHSATDAENMVCLLMVQSMRSSEHRFLTKHLCEETISAHTTCLLALVFFVTLDRQVSLLPSPLALLHCGVPVVVRRLKVV